MSELASFFEDAAERLFAEHVDASVVDAAGGGRWPADLWGALTEFSAPSILIAEANGGMGAAPFEAAAILRAAGRHAAPGLLLETMVANALLARAGLPIVSGPVALGFVECRGEDWRAAPQPPLRWLTQAAAAVLVIDAEDGLLAVTGPPGDARSGVDDPAGEPLARLGQGQLGTAEVRPLPGGFEAALSLASALRSAQMLGAMQWCLARTVEFTGERKQFGREIGKFQIIQQYMAEVAGEIAAGGAISAAALQRPQTPEGVLTTAAARARLGDATDVVVRLCHQIHGAMGFAAEYPLHHRTRRLMAWRDEFRSVSRWRRRLAEPFSGAAADEVWPKLTALRG
jgi:acyl-CoA dehydrogenase